MKRRDTTDTPTHVLMWVPRYLIKGEGNPGWDMLTYADAINGTPPDCPPTPDMPKDAPLVDLVQWVQREVGYPVVLVASTEQVKRHRWSIRWVNVPSYYVFPAGVRS